MSPQDRILDRIKKLLRLSRSSNPHEAALALERALALSAAHQIHLASVDPDDEVAGIRHKQRQEACRISLDKRLAMRLVSTYFSVKIIVGYKSLTIIGRAPDIQIAEYAYLFIVRSCRNCLADYSKAQRFARRKDSPIKRRNYVVGFMSGIDVQLRRFKARNPSADNAEALVKTDALERRRRDEYALQRWNLQTLPPPDLGRKNVEAQFDGWLAGNRTNIHQPIPAANLHHPRQLNPTKD